MTGYWQRWMVMWCWMVVGFGAMFAAAAVPAFRAPTFLFLDIVFWPIDGQPASLSREAVFSVALVGAIMIGWGLLMLGLAKDDRLSQDPRVWQIMTTATITWFVIDSLASWLSGAAVNVLGNIMFLGTFLVA